MSDSQPVGKRSLGTQQLAVMRSLDTTRSGSQILEAARKHAPKLTYADLRKILRKFECRGWIHCLNPKAKSGRIYSFTARGLAVATLSLRDFDFAKVNRQIDWIAYEALCRSIRLRMVLSRFAENWLGKEIYTPTAVRRKLSSDYPISSSAVAAAIGKLVNLGLLKRLATESKDARTAHYAITPKGRILVDRFSNG